MAKAKKGGLGRGLNSLLGDETEVVSRETTPVSAPKLAPVPASEPAPAPMPEQKAKEETTVESKKVSESKPDSTEQSAKQVIETSKELDMINEDKVTIKSVTERPVARQPEKKQDDRERRNNPRQVAEKGVDSETELVVPIDRVHPNPNQPRTNFKKEELEELSESIKRNGLLQPPIVRERGGQYEIIAGERRWQASNLAGLKEIPVRVLDVDDDQAIVIALIENIQRSDLNPIEEAYGYRRMMERGKMTQSQVAQAVSKGRSTIANALRLLELPEDAQQLLYEEKITAGHARAILSIPTKEGRSKLTKKLVDEQLSVRETEAIARLMSGKKEGEPSERPKTPKSYKTVARSLRDTLQTDVRVKSVKGKNKIEIAFKDDADLERLFRLITE